MGEVIHINIFNEAEKRRTEQYGCGEREKIQVQHHLPWPNSQEYKQPHCTPIYNEKYSEKGNLLNSIHNTETLKHVPYCICDLIHRSYAMNAYIFIYFAVENKEILINLLQLTAMEKKKRYLSSYRITSLRFNRYVINTFTEFIYSK